MQKHLVMTVTGNDRVGLVDDITKLILEFDGNIEASRMARLGGEFAILMLVSVPEDKFKGMRKNVRSLKKEGYKITTRQTEIGQAVKYIGWGAYQVEVKGADHEGIIHEITHHLAAQGINIDAMDTDVVSAPMSGTPLFTMTAVVYAPPHLNFDEWREELEDVGDALNVDTEVSPYVEK